MKMIKAEEIPVNARQFLQSLDLSDGEIVFNQQGAPWLVVVPANFLEQRHRAKQQVFALIEEIRRRNPEGDSDEILGELEELDHTESTRT